MPRSIWNGTIAFATVRVPVKLYAASESKAIRFRERHGEDVAAIEHRRVCEHEDREIPYSEVVKGLQTSSGEYVVLSKEEIAAADGPSARMIEVEHFVAREEIDPLYFDHPYYVGPGNDGEEGYRLLHAAMKRADRVGIGRFVFHNKAQLVAMRALPDVIAMHTMRFADEVLPPPAPDLEDGEAKLRKPERDVARTLVEQLESSFQPHRYKDTYREAVLEVIARKARGERIEAPPKEKESAPADLLGLLQESVKRAQKAGAGKPSAKSSSRAGSKSSSSPRTGSTAKSGSKSSSSPRTGSKATSKRGAKARSGSGGKR